MQQPDLPPSEPLGTDRHSTLDARSAQCATDALRTLIGGEASSASPECIVALAQAIPEADVGGRTFESLHQVKLIDHNESENSSVPAPVARKAPRIEVRRSSVHGKGVFACQPLEAGIVIAEYCGPIMTWRQAEQRRATKRSHRDDDHTFLFQISKRYVIDATPSRCRAKWINHSCAPNCQAVLTGRRVFIETLRHIDIGEELFFDYQLQASGDAQTDGSYPCHCASPQCRGTMLSA